MDVYLYVDTEKSPLKRLLGHRYSTFGICLGAESLERVGNYMVLTADYKLSSKRFKWKIKMSKENSCRLLELVVNNISRVKVGDRESEMIIRRALVMKTIGKMDKFEELIELLGDLQLDPDDLKVLCVCNPTLFEPSYEEP